MHIRSMNTFYFNTKGYDGFIDFIKAYAIICVLIAHTVPMLDKVGFCVWGDMQVPLFVLVQVFHCYKKEEITVNIKKIFSRIVLPFILLEFVTFFIAYFFNGYDINELLDRVLIKGGLGPGSYYPWVYLQIALLLPLFAIIMRRFNRFVSIILFIVICEAFEIILSLVNFPDWIYRLLFLRYLFLFCLGWLWAKEGVTVNRSTVIASLISLLSIIYFSYFYINDEPLFYSTGWKAQRWPCYFFVSFGFTAILHSIYIRINKIDWINRCVKSLASASYEIFLLQMSVLFLFHTDTLNMIIHLNNRYLLFSIWFILVWAFSIIGGVMLNKLINYSRVKENCIAR